MDEEVEIAKVEELVNEIRSLRKNIEDLKLKNMELNTRLYEAKTESASLKASLGESEKKVSQSEEKIRLLGKKHALELRRERNKVRKLDVFRDNSSKQKEQTRIFEEMKKANKVLLEFVKTLSKSLSFDPDLAAQLCEIAEDCNDSGIRAFVAGIKLSAGIQDPLHSSKLPCASLYGSEE